jgi:hypothetical protein
MGFIALVTVLLLLAFAAAEGRKASPPSLSCSASSLSSRASYSAPASSASTEAIAEAPTSVECGSPSNGATAPLRNRAARWLRDVAYFVGQRKCASRARLCRAA